MCRWQVTPARGTLYLLHLQAHQYTFTHMLGLHACSGWVLAPRSTFYGETLAYCPRVVYPLDFSGRWHNGELLCSFGFGLGI
jgi:hypothetical protein